MRIYRNKVCTGIVIECLLLLIVVMSDECDQEQEVGQGLVNPALVVILAVVLSQLEWELHWVDGVVLLFGHHTVAVLVVVSKLVPKCTHNTILQNIFIL